MNKKPNAYVRQVGLVTLASRDDGAGWLCTATCLGQVVGIGRMQNREAAEEAALDSVRVMWRALDHAIATLEAGVPS